MPASAIGLTQSQRLDRFAAALSAATGLTYDASRKWATAEVGSNNNLGIMAGPGQPEAYATPEEGAAAAAQLINSSPLYSGIRSSVASHDTHTQLVAIAQSPWHLGVHGLSKAGGTDPYYARVFGLGSITGGSSGGGYGGGSSSGGAGVPAAPASAPQYSIIDWLTGKAEAGIATDFAKTVILDGIAVTLGFIFIFIGLIMFLKGTSNPTEAIREVANDTIAAGMQAATAAAAPEAAVAGAAAKKAGNRSRRGFGADIRVEDAAGLRDSAPAGFSTETPRTAIVQAPVIEFDKARQRAYYAKRRAQGKAPTIDIA